MTQFAPLKDLVRVAQASTRPGAGREARERSSLQGAAQDPRFQQALKDDSLRRALEQATPGRCCAAT